MRIVVAAAITASSQVANTINTVKMAEAFARLGHKTTLVCFRPEGEPVLQNRLRDVYGLSGDLDWLQLPQRVFRRSVDAHWGFGTLALPRILMARPDLVFSRNYILPYLTARMGVPTVVESHAFIDNRSGPFLRMIGAGRFLGLRLMVTISHVLADHYHALGMPRDKLAVLSDAVDLRLFDRPTVLPPSPFQDGGPNVVYAGHLYDYKGIPTVLEAAARLPGMRMHLLGGLPEDLARQQSRCRELGLDNVVFHGLLSHSEVPPYLWHADVLLLPPSARHPSASWTSPVKLGEYLASGSPMVVSDIPALRDWLTDDEALFVVPDDPDALALGIRGTLDEPAAAHKRAVRGMMMAKGLSYELRAEKIMQMALGAR